MNVPIVRSPRQFMRNVDTFTDIAGELAIGDKFESCAGDYYEVVDKEHFYITARSIAPSYVGRTDCFGNSAKVRRISEVKQCYHS